MPNPPHRMRHRHDRKKRTPIVNKAPLANDSGSTPRTTRNTSPAPTCHISPRSSTLPISRHLVAIQNGPFPVDVTSENTRSVSERLFQVVPSFSPRQLQTGRLGIARQAGNLDQVWADSVGQHQAGSPSGGRVACSVYSCGAQQMWSRRTIASLIAASSSLISTEVFP